MCYNVIIKQNENIIHLQRYGLTSKHEIIIIVVDNGKRGVKLSLFTRIFKGKENRQLAKAGLIQDNTAIFTSWSGNAYANDIYRGAVDAIARNAGKLKGTHIVKYSGVKKEAVDQRLNKLLQVSPNEYMNSYDFIYKLVTHYYLYNNAFAFINKDDRGNVLSIYPVTCTQADFITDTRGTLYLQFRFKNGSTALLPYSDVIHLRRDFNSDELLGDDNSALIPALELAHTQNEGIINGIKSSANIRGILKYTQILAPEKLEQEKQKFITDYLSMNNSGGVVVTDPKTEYTPITSSVAPIDAEQLKTVQTKIYNYLGVTEKIVNSSYDENEYNSFYESVLEPLCLQLSLEFTRKIFTDRELAFGNSIVFDSGRMIYSNNGTKVNLIKELLPYGVLTINQALEILNLPPVTDGDKRLQTLNVVDAEKANQYQLQDSTEGNNDVQEDKEN